MVVSLIVRALAFTYVRREPAVSSSARLHETGARCFLKCPSSFLNVTAALLEPDALKGFKLFPVQLPCVFTGLIPRKFMIFADIVDAIIFCN